MERQLYKTTYSPYGFTCVRCEKVGYYEENIDPLLCPQCEAAVAEEEEKEHRPPDSPTIVTFTPDAYYEQVKLFHYGERGEKLGWLKGPTPPPPSPEEIHLAKIKAIKDHERYLRDYERGIQDYIRGAGHRPPVNIKPKKVNKFWKR